MRYDAWPLADIPRLAFDVRFSNRPFGVKRFQTIHHYSVDVAHGLVLLFRIGTKALVWGFLVKEFRPATDLISFGSFFVRSESPFLRSSTMARLSAVGMTIRGEPASGRGSIAPQPCIR